MKRLACLLGAATLMAASAVSTAFAFTVWCPDQIGPTAKLSPNGRHIIVVLGGRLQDWQPGQHVTATVTVLQPSTGASAGGLLHSNQTNLSPPPPLPPVLANAVGKNSFQPGVATVTYFAQVREKGVVVRQWSHTAQVLLIP